jgi:RNA polymerase primary sigma factor
MRDAAERNSDRPHGSSLEGGPMKRNTTELARPDAEVRFAASDAGAPARAIKNVVGGVTGAAAPDLASLGLLDDDATEDTAVRARPTTEIVDEPSADFIDLDLPVVDRVVAEAPARPAAKEMKDVEEGGGDSMLARYFRDMALHPVMGPEEVLQTARTVGRTEIDHWVALLSYLPAAEHILFALEQDVLKAGEEEVQAPQIGELGKLVRSARKQRGKLTSNEERQWGQLATDLARKYSTKVENE